MTIEITADRMNAIFLEQLRGRILEELDQAYPQSLHSDVLHLKTDGCIRDIVRELHYLEEKDWSRSKTSSKTVSWHASLLKAVTFSREQ